MEPFWHCQNDIHLFSVVNSFPYQPVMLGLPGVRFHKWINCWSAVGVIIAWRQVWVNNIWGLCCQKHISQAGISNYIPRLTVGCNYLSLPEIPASGNNVLICTLLDNTTNHDCLVVNTGETSHWSIIWVFVLDHIPTKSEFFDVAAIIYMYSMHVCIHFKLDR